MLHAEWSLKWKRKQVHELERVTEVGSGTYGFGAWSWRRPATQQIASQASAVSQLHEK